MIDYERVQAETPLTRGARRWARRALILSATASVLDVGINARKGLAGQSELDSIGRISGAGLGGLVGLLSGIIERRRGGQADLWILTIGGAAAGAILGRHTNISTPGDSMPLPPGSDYDRLKT